MSDIPLSLYIHIPWCVRKCPYCDFNSHLNPDDANSETHYVQALIQDLDFELDTIKDRTIETIFFGGGTPSLFSGQSIATLMRAIRERVCLADSVEVTLEANPGASEAERFQAYREAGVNRLSIGVQSLSNEMLERLGRIHNQQEAIDAADLAKAAGFKQINLDMMFALPEQSLQQAIDDLQGLVALQPSHISWYQLTLEPNTVYYQKPPKLPHDDLTAEMQQAGQSLLSESGFSQYEVSAYSQTPCRHNLNYWQFGDYVAIGAGAHGKITDSEQDRIYRYAKLRAPNHYMSEVGKNSVYTEQRVLSEQDIVFEFMLNALRLKDGIRLDTFTRRTGKTLASIEPLLSKACELGLLNVDSFSLKPTHKGWCYLNDLMEIFL